MRIRGRGTSADDAAADSAGAGRPNVVEPWERFANAVLQAEAIVRRMHGVLPRDFAGLVIEDEEVDRIARELPGLDGPDLEDEEAAHAAFADQVDAARTALHDWLANGRARPFAAIAHQAELSADEAEILALVATVERGPQQQRLVGYLQDNVSAPRLWVSTLGRLLPPPHLGSSAVSAGACMRRAELVSLEGDGPWATRSVGLADRVAWRLSGAPARDADLPARARLIARPELDPAGDAMVLVTGADRVSRLEAAFAKARGNRFLVTPVPTTPEQWRAVVREATVEGLTPVLELDADPPTDFAYWLERAAHLAWAVSSRSELALESLPQRAWRELNVGTGAAELADWQRHLDVEPDPAHRLNREQLELVAAAFEGVDRDLRAAVRRLASGHLDRLAVKVRPRRGWDDLILPRHQVRQLRELVGRYRYRPRVYEDWGFSSSPSAGIVALFAGQSGTGKTLAAEVVAADLGLDLYKIDLSTVVSKYIGETEKNLEEIFTAAAAGNLVLFFDEADAIFGKRSEVSDAHDRYANIEVAYLLQRLETYDGLVVLATNLQGNIDQAFLRRIHVAVDFPMPEPPERQRIWTLSIAKTAPQEDLDVEFLARQFKIAGGNIRNAALTAAFLAAEADQPINMACLVQGLDRELEKMGRLRDRDDFGPYKALLDA